MNQTLRLPSLRRAAFALLLSLCLLAVAGLARAATQIDILAPPAAASSATGRHAAERQHRGTDPFYDDGAIVDVGAVYLYDGASTRLISTLTGHGR